MRWHRAWQLTASWVFTLGFGVASSLALLLTFGLWSRSMTPFLLRFWGRVMLRIAGVRIEVEGREHLLADEMRVATFNHGSMLDAFLITAIMPPGSVAAVKREIGWYPVVGVALYLMGFVFIDRRNNARARTAMARACQRMHRNRLVVFMAPEGTRAPGPDPLPFKKGAFHLALASGAAILPVVLDGAFELHPRGRFTSSPGVVRIRVLAPRDTSGFTPETIDAEARALHATYVRELALMRAERAREESATVAALSAELIEDASAQHGPRPRRCFA